MRKLVALSLVLASGALFADGNSDSAQATASVRIVAPIRVVNNSDLSFGNIVVDDMNTPAEVTLTTSIKPGDLHPTATLTNWKKCAPFKRQGEVSAAGFHYSYDVWAAKADLSGVKISIPETVTLSGGYGAACTVKTNNDLPADDCFLSNSHLNPQISGYTSQKHFGVGGTLSIPAGALGYKEGKFTVTVEYI